MKEHIKEHPNGAYDVAIIIMCFQEEGLQIVYSPSLKISSYGKTLKEAQVNFDSTLDSFFEFEQSKKRLGKTLTKLGWIKRSLAERLTPPKEDIKVPYHILAQPKNSQVKLREQSVRVPAYA